MSLSENLKQSLQLWIPFWLKMLDLRKKLFGGLNGKAENGADNTNKDQLILPNLILESASSHIIILLYVNVLFRFVYVKVTCLCGISYILLYFISYCLASFE
ncbi:hypothetical protein ACS0TY_034051 [Phlomoides rotata]